MEIKAKYTIKMMVITTLDPEFFYHNHLFLDANVYLILFGCVNSLSA
jgi:hypothetical protein